MLLYFVKCLQGPGKEKDFFYIQARYFKMDAKNLKMHLLPRKQQYTLYQSQSFCRFWPARLLGTVDKIVVFTAKRVGKVQCFIFIQLSTPTYQFLLNFYKFSLIMIEKLCVSFIKIGSLENFLQ